MPSVYDFNLKSLLGQDIAFSKYQNKVLLIVNVASKCGFTKQYTGLETLYKTYQAQGLEILGFPCNQFGAQEPGTAEEIVEFCSRTYGVSFPLTAKVDVNGPNETPVYKFLKSASGNTADIVWNFEKFLVDKEGNVKRFSPKVTPEELAPQIAALL
ncbi:peroxiredoxin [Chytridium lagenaria]|nr:peroxiredoxin [Chytridium lagenaria]